MSDLRWPSRPNTYLPQVALGQSTYPPPHTIHGELGQGVGLYGQGDQQG